MVLKKEYLDELFLLMRSFLIGERLLKEGKPKVLMIFLSLSPRKRNENFALSYYSSASGPIRFIKS
ncbi:MAG: hypothetical protein COT33_01910 [Candidatus Nealsonbacteria bacterium CG08_land_8_20_14_0_20_38_20]|uniref:Uncharacterized protein n=1 Tax=Candidatus Nealsonbacteria bacterium CG08_land_8_20_14_0_20_38_20 TaxID=1974705 RepID=A0A2H0YNY3_9BACT|nr:MAG: hypothetical protein COT33_01910 [Candidatus Nealsonbacteria bacterium CG08_land_8_20_14_0_20_38_20]